MLARTKAAVATKRITAPEPGAISYMQSKRQYVNDASHNWHPHVMFLLPPIDATSLGAGQSVSPVYGATSDVEPITIVFVVSPARRSSVLRRGHQMLRLQDLVVSAPAYRHVPVNPLLASVRE